MLKDELKKWPVQLGILLFLLALFLITNSVLHGTIIPTIFALSIVVALVYFVVAEVGEGTRKHGWKHEALDTAIALLAAIAIWYGASFVLNTSTPVSGVVSCSMLPNLERGDFVIVQGAPVDAYQINMTASELRSLNSRSDISYPGGNVSMDGSALQYCTLERYSGMSSALCQAFFQSPSSVAERKGAFTYGYALCSKTYKNGTIEQTPCLRSIGFRGKEYLANFSNSVIVYQPPAGDYYSRVGDIVHRVLFVIDVDGKRYYLTRGDNNPILDLQVYDMISGMKNHPIPQENVRGKVIARIPYLGYLKLFISGYFDEDSQCRTQLAFDHV